MTDSINPDHYKASGLEAIDVIEAYFPNDPHLANVFKYIARAGKKESTTILEDLEKAKWYLNRKISLVEKAVSQPVDFEDSSPRVWERLDYIPPGVIVRSYRGVYYRRVGGTAHFEWSTSLDDGWEKTPLWYVTNWENCGPYTEVRT